MCVIPFSPASARFVVPANAVDAQFTIEFAKGSGGLRLTSADTVRFLNMDAKSHQTRGFRDG